MITVKGLHKRFNGLKAVDGMDFECVPGEMIALVGPNGSGKSTALKIIAGIMRRDGGEVRLGEELVDLSSVELRKRISYLPQRVAFPDQITAKEVLTFFARLRGIGRERIDQLVSAFGFHGFEKKKVAELSGGMLQRLALAVVFLPEADLYILDEATNNLDSEGLTRFREQALAVMDRGASIILSTHLLKEVENLAHKIAIVSKGRIVLVERIEQFIEDVSQTRKMWITMDNLSDRFRSLALAMGANEAILNCNTMTVDCGEDDRIPILSALAQDGAVIKQFGLYEPSLEDVYQQVLGSHLDES